MMFRRVLSASFNGEVDAENALILLQNQRSFSAFPFNTAYEQMASLE